MIALSLLSHLDKLYDENCSVEVINVFKMWLSDGGEPTIKEYLLLDVDNRKRILKTLANALISKEIYVNGNKFILAHTVSGVDNICDFDEWKLEDFIEGEPDYDEIYFDDMFVVTGHTPTEYIDVHYKGKIWRGNNHIAIDCGAVFGNPLGCLCLDTFEEFYV